MSHRIGVDIGGTFTDCVVVDAAGRRTIAKSRTTPGELELGVLDALAQAAAQLDLTRPQLLSQTDQLVHGTTQATNAVLTRTGSPTGLITTRGHEDALLIGKLYSKVAGLAERDLVRSSRLRKPEPLVPRARIHGVSERVDRDGEVLVPLDEAEVVTAIGELLAAGVEAIAVSLLWSFANDRHEARIAELLAEHAPGVFVSLSHRIAPVLGEYERTVTTVVNAYVGPVLGGYLARLQALLGEEGLAPPMLIMQASGGLTSVDDAARRPIVTLDSGPTGGILGCQHLGRMYGERNVICTDVGGTSFDVGLILDDEVPLEAEPVVSQYVLRMPKVLVSSIGSGGGSVAWIDEGGLLRVGPHSAGARPGPASYASGGTEATVTDADLVLGLLDPDHFLGGRMRLDRDLALGALGRLGSSLGLEPEEVAVGVFRIINAQMADLIRKSTIEQGHDPRDCILVAYGGAGPTHSVFYGAQIGARQILVLAGSTAFSAEGMLTCDVTHTAETSHIVDTPFSDAERDAISARFEGLEQRVLEQFAAEGTAASQVTLARTLGVRFRQQVQTVDVPVRAGPFDVGAGERLPEDFLARYAQVYGTGALVAGGRPEVERHRVVGTLPLAPVAFAEHEPAGPDPEAARTGERPAWFEATGFTATAVFDGARLRPGNAVDGPAIIERMGDSIVVPPGFGARVDRFGNLGLTPADGA
jgi:N-methylhydantoinase A/oxoprolinase/acetone carboxylase beta subunit